MTTQVDLIRRRKPADSRPATFLYYSDTHGDDKPIHLYQMRDGRWKVRHVDYPELDSAHQSAIRAVEAFAGWREMSMKDWGASEVDWGSYPHLARYWPEFAQSWETSL